MIVYMFMEQFAANVQMGQKPCTIRPDGDKVPFVGQPVSLRRWSGKPYRSKQIELRQAYISRVRPIVISRFGTIKLGSKAISLHAVNQLAEQDGFESAHDLLEWFSDNHGLPFKGIFIEWDDTPRLYVGCEAEHTYRSSEDRAFAFSPNVSEKDRLKYIDQYSVTKKEDVSVLAIVGKFAWVRPLADRRNEGHVVKLESLRPFCHW